MGFVAPGESPSPAWRATAGQCKWSPPLVSTRGTHLLVEYRGCESEVLDDVDRVRALMLEAAEAAGATVVGELLKPYAPQGVTGVVVIEESHFSIHTWPECRYAAVDFYTCGSCDPLRAHAVLARGLGAASAERMIVARGLSQAGASLRMEEHTQGEGALDVLGRVHERPRSD